MIIDQEIVTACASGKIRFLFWTRFVFSLENATITTAGNWICELADVAVWSVRWINGPPGNRKDLVIEFPRFRIFDYFWIQSLDDAVHDERPGFPERWPTGGWLTHLPQMTTIRWIIQPEGLINLIGNSIKVLRKLDWAEGIVRFLKRGLQFKHVQQRGLIVLLVHESWFRSCSSQTAYEFCKWVAACWVRCKGILWQYLWRGLFSHKTGILFTDPNLLEAAVIYGSWFRAECQRSLFAMFSSF